MSDEVTAPDEVAKSRKGLVAALLAIVLVLAAIVGVAYAMGIGPFAPAEVPVAAKPEPAAEPAEVEETTAVVPVAAPVTVPLPPADAQEAMYWEQVASGEQIGSLVADKIASFELSQIATGAGTADIRVKATYRDASVLNGWMLLRQYEGAWYFSMITADGHSTTTPVSGTADAAVAKVMAEQQAANQEVPKAILDGGYTKITVNRVTTGSGTAMMDITLSGGKAAESKGQITCISKDVAGTTHWFITAFSKL